MSQRFCRMCGEWHQTNEWPSECIPVRTVARSDLPMPMIRVDTTPPLRSMADGKVYTSKAAMRASYKASGNPQGIEYTEVGDDRSFVNPAPKPLKRADRKAVREAVERGKADVAAGRYDHIQ